MNNVVLIGRLTREPQINGGTTTVAKYTLAVDRHSKEKTTDFISCVAFGKSADFAKQYLHKGTKIAVRGWIRTGSYEKDGVRIYTTDVQVEAQEFAESKQAQAEQAQPAKEPKFMPVGEDEFLPFL